MASSIAPRASSGPGEPAPASSNWRLACVTLLVGLGAGLGGMALSLLLHAIQHLAYGYGGTALVGTETFFEGVSAASRDRRLVALVVCGSVAAAGWGALARWGRPRVDIARAVADDDARMPVATTIVHALLQIVTVALGSPLGREVAPREIGAVVAGTVARRLGLQVADVRIMLACGAGAGLAAVYNVPLAGGVFTLEVLLATFARRALIPALVTSTLAAVVAWIGLGNEAQYRVPAFDVDASLIVWSVVAGPLIGIVAEGFRRLAVRVRPSTSSWSPRKALTCLGVFAAIGALSGWFPQILGNGKGPAQLGFDGDLAADTATIVLLLKIVVVMAAIRVGAYGGLMTPALSCGALLAIVLGHAWSMWWPGPAAGAYASIGAAAFLATSMAMPLTAIMLVFEFTRIRHDFVVPIVLAVGGSVVASRLCAQAIQRRTASGATSR